MTVSLKHEFVSVKADGPDTTRVQPSDWNAEHNLTLASNRLLGRYTDSPDPGDVEEITVGTGLDLSNAGVLSLNTSATALATGLVGKIEEWPGPELPSGYIWAAGQAVSRSTYALLFAALTVTLTADTTASSGILASASKNITALGLLGCTVEGTGIPSGATITAATATEITISPVATATNLGATIRILPWGVGDGSTTFNVPDKRGRTGVGRDNMNGSAASRWAAATRLGYTGGAETHTITTAEMAAHGHTITVASGGSHTHGFTTSSDGSHTHTASLSLSTAGSHNHGGVTGSSGLHDHTVDIGTNNAAAGTDRNTIEGSTSTESTSEDGTHTHTISTDGSHTHTISGSLAASGTHTHTGTTDSGGSHTHTATASNTGSGTAHNNMQPSVGFNYIIFTGVA